MKEAPPESTENRRRSFGKRRWWLIALFLAACAYPAWREYDFRCAVSEAKAAGLYWDCIGPLTLIRQDWHYALEKRTWSLNERQLQLGRVPDIARYQDLIYRLRPTLLGFSDGKTVKLDTLKNLNSLNCLTLHYCEAIQNLDALKGIANLKTLVLVQCSSLKSADTLKNLTYLRELNIQFCDALQDVEALKALTNLQKLVLTGSNKVPAASLRELRAALPNTNITFPDGINLPPQ